MDYVKLLLANESFWYVSALIVLISCIKSKSIRKRVKGWFAEVVVDYYLNQKLDLSSSIILHDILIPTKDGGTTQIDHIIIAPSGIYVIETKAYAGWITGTRNSEKWIQHFSKRNKYPFQNPYRQNYKHIKTLSENLNIPMDSFKNTIFFFGKFKSKKITGLYLDLYSFLIDFNNNESVIIEDVQSVSDLIWENKIENTMKSKRAHTKHVKEIVKKKN